MIEHAEKLLKTIDRLLYAAEFNQLIEACKVELLDARKRTDRESEAAALIGLAEAHRFIGKFRDARVYNDGAINYAQEVNARELLARALIVSGSLFMMERYHLDEAETDYRAALNLAHEIQASESVIAALAGIAAVLQEVGNQQRALNYAREVFELARETGAVFYMTIALGIMGSVFAHENQHEKALKTYQDALEICQQNNLKILEGGLIGSIGIIMIETKRYLEEGFLMMQRSIEMAQTIHCIPQEFIALYRMGNTHRLQANYPAAQEFFETMLQKAQIWKNRPYEAISFYELGRLHLYTAAYDEALVNLEQALLINRETMNPFSEAQAETVMGYVCSLQHDYDAALDHYMAARVLYDALDDPSHARAMMQAIVITYISRFFDRILRFFGLRKRDDD